ncbi:Lrp/AsnC family transcriptional regulator [Marinilongibacter aquaticus]|uniref:Lrp/AsnC family transcriptional regulator n=1 Tax=Marinilongibacter aquaticus TaxID=2975157 RepID=UPI0021BD1B8F|nr:Lrp/AsnC family transcriptional regulator [Marinilongibacter aquaticus]UBM59282.1 Lrp/AsnC family transcriptional regulator [Marinilongibacter aquaticus]
MEKELDEVDIFLLKSLQADAKTTAKEFAAQLNMSVSPIYERIKRLEQKGYIKKYVAILDKTKLNRSITCICQVSMRQHSEAFIDNFEKEIRKIEEVQECFHMAGEVDFFLKINIGSLEDYHYFVRTKLSRIENISVLNTTFVLKDIKNGTEISF